MMNSLFIASIPLLIIFLIVLLYNLKNGKSTTEICLIIIAFCMLLNTGYTAYTHIQAKKMMEKMGSPY